MNSLGRHLMADFYRCSMEVLSDLEQIRAIMLEAAVRCGATIVGMTSHQFSGMVGHVSVVVLIAESHISILTFPEYGYAAVDVFTCGVLNPDKAISHLAEQLSAKEHTLVERHRGVFVRPLASSTSILEESMASSK